MKTLESPQSDWSLDQLTDYVVKGFAQASVTQKEFTTLGRRAAVEYFHCGNALALIRERRKESRSWKDWLKATGLNYQTAHRAILLYERAGSVKAIGNLTITEAYTAFGITKQTTVKAHCRNLPFAGAAAAEASTDEATQPRAEVGPVLVAQPAGLCKALTAIVGKLKSLPAIGSEDPAEVAKLVEEAATLLASIQPAIRIAA